MTILRVVALGIVAAVSLAVVRAQAPSGTNVVDSTTEMASEPARHRVLHDVQPPSQVPVLSG